MVETDARNPPAQAEFSDDLIVGLEEWVDYSIPGNLTDTSYRKSPLGWLVGWRWRTKGNGAMIVVPNTHLARLTSPLKYGLVT